MITPTTPMMPAIAGEKKGVALAARGVSPAAGGVESVFGEVVTGHNIRRWVSTSVNTDPPPRTKCGEVLA
ncbi:hypothetical protein HMPREF0281_02087 [Corynebacterium ammoniagenes DSM 20306]|uniref:Uncharacterized protein n=1 Tax=Corynebacterium ammoniagenes DSM 20306 TaxID=649754 RepID=A0ABP2IDP3_CORAM|nr:hypothetical protein HMPREF0281_02087 [Corynebacterium ammoniagenes DSM 20306]